MAKIPTSRRFGGRLYKQGLVTNSKLSAKGDAEEFRKSGHRARVVRFPSLSLYVVYWRPHKTG